MSGVIATIPKFAFLTQNGAPLSGGTMEIYLSGTSTPSPSWQDEELTILNTNPIVLDSRGECMIWLQADLRYKFVLKNSVGVVQWTQNNIVGGNIAGDPSFSIFAAAIYAATTEAETSAAAALDASTYLNTYINEVVMNITFPLDLGLVSDPFLYNSFDLGAI
jgi:hypothetical protein